MKDRIWIRHQYGVFNLPQLQESKDIEKKKKTCHVSASLFFTSNKIVFKTGIQESNINILIIRVNFFLKEHFRENGKYVKFFQ